MGVVEVAANRERERKKEEGAGDRENNRGLCQSSTERESILPEYAPTSSGEEASANVVEPNFDDPTVSPSLHSRDLYIYMTHHYLVACKIPAESRDG